MHHAASVSQTTPFGVRGLPEVSCYFLRSKPLTQSLVRPRTGLRQTVTKECIQGRVQNCKRHMNKCCAAEISQYRDDLPVNEEFTWEWRARTMKGMLAFALPALAIPLADPLLSVVDTLCVSQVSLPALIKFCVRAWELDNPAICGASC